VVLWCRRSAPDESSGYHHLYPLADKIIFDTQGAADADAALRALRRLHAYGMRVADLHWARLTGWREALAHLFDDGFRARDVRLARVTYGGGAVTTCARYFEAWLRASLPQARVGLEPDYGPPGLYSVTLSTPRGDLTLTRQDEHNLTVTGPGLDYTANLPPSTEAAVMREELGILGADSVYERVLNA
jgi:glucose-6-phosphate dehydrogenase assembly protein OpcA